MPRGRPVSGGINKSDEIRKYFEAHPESKTKDCITFLAGKNIEVSQALVAGVRGRMTGEAGTKRKKKGEISVGEIKLVKNFVDKSHLEASVATKTLMELANLIEEIGSIERFKDVVNEFSNFDGDSETDESDEDEDAVTVGAEYDDVNDEDEDEDEDE